MSDRTTAYPDSPSAGDVRPAGHAPSSGAVSPGVAFSEFARSLNQARAFFSFYLTTQLDRAKITARKLAVLAVAAVLAAFVGITAMVVATLFVCLGLADLLGSLTGHLWIGYLVVGIAIVGAVAAVILFGSLKITKLSRQSTFAGYQRRKRQQRDLYGTDVHERAQGN